MPLYQDLHKAKESTPDAGSPVDEDHIIVLVEVQYGSAMKKFRYPLPQPTSVVSVLRTVGLRFDKDEIKWIAIERPVSNADDRYHSTCFTWDRICDGDEVDYQLRSGDWLRITLRPPPPPVADRILAKCLAPLERWFGYSLVGIGGFAVQSFPRDPDELSMPFTTIGK
jgi:hypothetical protein